MSRARPRRAVPALLALLAAGPLCGCLAGTDRRAREVGEQGEVCAEADAPPFGTICLWEPRFAGFRDAHCGAGGACDGAPTRELLECLEEFGVAYGGSRAAPALRPSRRPARRPRASRARGRPSAPAPQSAPGSGRRTACWISTSSCPAACSMAA